ncbi:hypothetical protein NP493_267g00027 [Ridgeia piscesae]|uniref:Uncharacterized protein n=1 Tax=Ridgeia piscesae TaxID=27915 RepID=A0AAD9NXR1_RIDPI|nr:hypothetical protein NP493_267g00027 [Ridgeia piscesae]
MSMRRSRLTAGDTTMSTGLLGLNGCRHMSTLVGLLSWNLFSICTWVSVFGYTRRTLYLAYFSCGDEAVAVESTTTMTMMTTHPATNASNTGDRRASIFTADGHCCGVRAPVA